jgi:beta-glucuronidase
LINEPIFIPMGVFLEGLICIPQVPWLWISARIFFQEEVQNTEIVKICFKVCIREYNSSGKRGHTLLEIENPNFSSQTNMEFSFVLPDARIWTLDDPALYELIVRVDDGKHSDTVIERFGIRIVGTDKGQITLNGQPVKLLGYNRHESHPQFGPALPYSQLVQDLQILKDLNCNFIRGSHYPQDQRFLDLCDESGFLFFEESFSWQHNDRHFSRPDFMEDMELQNRLMVRNSYNHPSVIMWGFLNEGDSHKESSRQAYESCFRAIREEDRTRLITYATNHPLDDLYLELCDVISINTYPGWYEMDDEDPAEEVTRPLDRINQEINLLIEHKNSSNHKNKPLILSEIGAGAIYGWRDSLRSHWTEGYQEDYLETVCTRICEDDALAGVALWQFCDGRTYQSGRAVKRPSAFKNVV